jgi:hypothetical protein
MTPWEEVREYCRKCRLWTPFYDNHVCPPPKNGYLVIKHPAATRVSRIWVRLNIDSYQYKRINRFWASGYQPAEYLIINFQKREKNDRRKLWNPK